ncbi:MAG: tRNA 2-thiocytidine biosynthesis protein TtcA [Bradymonadia bacterium]|jgi:tRNA 2-thiocytidine biosynthesis protein TtcA
MNAGEPNTASVDPVTATAAPDALGVSRCRDEPCNKLRSKLIRQMTQASKTFDMLAPDDRVMVCLSGGKDSWVLLDLLGKLVARLPFSVDLIAVNLDQGHPGFQQHVIAEYCEQTGVRFEPVMQDTYSVVLEKVPEGRTQCSLCSRMRRGILYRTAERLGCTKIALGHHRDDILETALLNLFYGGKLATMPPRLQSDDGRNVVIRPLALCAEQDVATYAAHVGFPILPCDLCGSQENLHRQQMKSLLSELSANNPRVPGNMLAALGNVNPSHLLDLPLQASLEKARE